MRDSSKVDSIKDLSNNLVDRIREFMENEARSCSMDYGCVTPQYVSRMWGGTVPMDEIAVALKEAKRQLI